MCKYHRCHIVPPYILEELAKRGSHGCKRTLNDSHRILQKRSTALNQILIEDFFVENGDRLIYDCKNQFQQRISLVLQEGGSKIEDEVANAAYATSGFVREYYRDTFGLNSVNGEGMDLVSNVHFGLDYNNAYWDGDEMTYGDGDNKDFKDFASAIDVVAHELTHGVTQFLANLEYYGQSGALNEHFSDVFGTIIKQQYLNQTIADADWLIGDLVVTEHFPGVAIRSMSAPGTANDYDRQPDHMKNYYTGTADNQGVHINSGIPNKAFYLSCQEIGIEDCALIWFQTLKSLWRTANFKDMLVILKREGQKLVEEKRVGMGAVAGIEKSFRAVGIEVQVV
ncbi:M4 family metallopeptidase [Flavobacteriaceae bacterium F89]|uniref:Neutral metalloproteinase n=1 Tax=Cerina litoralis TaxID=2874477 RepID=A0AAE3ERP5_9FLAO|nr:M4 family metallopeptidase [Cerina litoralis]MCG2459668.1 M4 family metallopeptidase [Cerina litoralis]